MKNMRNLVFLIWIAILILGCMAILICCLEPINFNPDPGKTEISGEISTTDVTAAVLMITNRSKTVDVTNVTITQPEWQPAHENSNAQAPFISFANKPKRLEKKAQYLTPSDKSYQVVIDYAYDALGDIPEGTGTQTLIIPLPIPRQIVEIFVYRNTDGDIIIDKEVTFPEPDDTGNPPPDTSHGEGSVPSVIPPEYRNVMATFIVISKTNSQTIDSVNFKMGKNDYTMGSIGANNRQSIALGQGSWETKVTYVREGVTKVLGPVNAIIVPSHDPQAIREHYLYFYLNKRGDYSISQDWPPDANDVAEEDVLPPDDGFGRGVIKIINNSYALAKTVTIHNVRDPNKIPLIINYSSFTPSVPVQYKKIGFVDVVGTTAFPIEAHDDYLIQVSLETSDTLSLFEQRAYIKDQVVTIIIDAEDIDASRVSGAKVTLQNQTNVWPVEIVSLTVRNTANAYQSSYYTAVNWIPARNIASGADAVQYVLSTPTMPIHPNAQFGASIAIYAGGKTAVITKTFNEPVLYSELLPDENPRTLTITDNDVPDELKEAISNSVGAQFTIQNRISSYPVQVIGFTVKNKTKPAENFYYPVNIAKNQDAVRTVMSSSIMPIRAGEEFKADVALLGGGITRTVEKTFTPATLYSTLSPELNPRTVIVTDADVPQDIIDVVNNTKGAKVTLKNEVRSVWPVQILKMTVINTAVPAEKTDYSISNWQPAGAIANGQSANVMVMGSNTMPINQDVQFKAAIQITGNGQTATIDKAFSPAVLYSALSPEQNTRTIIITDSDVPAGLQPPPAPLHDAKGAAFTITNSISSWPVEIIGVTIRNKALPGENSSYGSYSWLPNGNIGKARNAVAQVLESTAMPIRERDQFEAIVTLFGCGQTANVPKTFSPAELYSTLAPEQNPRAITLTDTDVPQVIRDAYGDTRGARVTIKNEVKSSWPIQIVTMTVRNKTAANESVTYGTSTWEPKELIGNHGTANQMVLSSAAMPIRENDQFEAVVTLYGNGNTATVTKTFSPTTALYSTGDPALNGRTITITDADVPANLQPVVPVVPPTPEAEKQDEIAKAANGDLILIDGIIWVKVRTDNTDKDKVLLMKYEVIPGSGANNYYMYHNNVVFIDYFHAKILDDVNGWYKKLPSPILKNIALVVSLEHQAQGQAVPLSILGMFGVGASQGRDLAGTITDMVAFIPRYADIVNIKDKPQILINYYDYWLSDFVDTGLSNAHPNIGIVRAPIVNSQTGAVTPGTVYHREATGYAAIRPCIWVTTKH